MCPGIALINYKGLLLCSFWRFWSITCFNIVRWLQLRFKLDIWKDGSSPWWIIAFQSHQTQNKILLLGYSGFGLHFSQLTPISFIFYLDVWPIFHHLLVVTLKNCCVAAKNRRLQFDPKDYLMSIGVAPMQRASTSDYVALWLVFSSWAM